MLIRTGRCFRKLFFKPLFVQSGLLPLTCCSACLLPYWGKERPLRSLSNRKNTWNDILLELWLPTAKEFCADWLEGCGKPSESWIKTCKISLKAEFSGIKSDGVLCTTLIGVYKETFGILKRFWNGSIMKMTTPDFNDGETTWNMTRLHTGGCDKNLCPCAMRLRKPKTLFPVTPPKTAWGS